MDFASSKLGDTLLAVGWVGWLSVGAVGCWLKWDGVNLSPKPSPTDTLVKHGWECLNSRPPNLRVWKPFLALAWSVFKVLGGTMTKPSNRSLLPAKYFLLAATYTP